MTYWINDDGLMIRFNGEGADNARGGEINTDNLHAIVFDLDYTDVQSATPTILKGSDGFGKGVLVNNMAVPVKTEVLVTEAWTSSGTIGSATLVLGTKKASDRTTELDHDGFTTSAFVGSRLDGVGELSVIKVGETGAGDDYGVEMSENGLVVVSNSQHASHPYTAGHARVTIWYLFTENTPPEGE